jgi:hypothetical protein
MDNGTLCLRTPKNNGKSGTDYNREWVKVINISISLTNGTVLLITRRTIYYININSLNLKMREREREREREFLLVFYFMVFYATFNNISAISWRSV